MQKLVANIHLGNIRYNAELFSALTGKRLCAVVKANAYGHGAEEVVNVLSGVADCFAVALIEEGLSIRTAACGKDVLVFTPPISEEEGYALAANGFIASVPDLWTAKLLSSVCGKYRLPIKVHLKVNTGMNRYGMNGSMLGKVCKFLQSDPFVKVEGIYSHLYECNPQTAAFQRDLFECMERICKRYFPNVISHLGATYGTLLGKEYAFDMVRIGIGLYGYLPNGVPQESLPLKKGMTVYARSVAERRLSFGGVGYGPTQAKKGERISLYRFGYADGFLRKKKNGVCGGEKNANDLCMDVCIREECARRGRYVPVLTDADETAKATDTISYEVLCAVTRRAEFIYDYDEIPLCGHGFKNGERKEKSAQGLREKTPYGKR